MYQYASDLAGAWLEYLQVTMAQAPYVPVPRSPPGPRVGGFGVGVNAAPASSTEGPATRVDRGHGQAAVPPTVSVQIASKRRTEVTADLKPGSAQDSLAILDLRARDAALPRISGVAIEATRSENRVTVRIEVSDEHRPAIYTGLIVDDATNLPRGTLTVRVFE
jgi:hypothetical protein